MKICVPVSEDRGLDSIPYGHFGSAPHFLIYNTENEKVALINNQNLHHGHGQCNPIQALEGSAVDVVIVGGIGGRAVMRLQDAGIKVYQSIAGPVGKNIELFEQSQLTALTVEDGCNQHGGCEA